MIKKLTLVFAFLVVMAAAAGQAYAIDSSEFALTTVSGFYDQRIFVYYENPAWTPPTVNLTLDTGGLTIVNNTDGTTSNSTTNFAGSIFMWELSAAGPGIYSLNLTADDGNGTAYNELPLDLLGSTDPVLDATAQDITTVPMGQNFTFQVDLNNTGNGPADNIDVYLDMLDASSNSPQSLASINNGSTGNVVFDVAPGGTCASYLARAIVDYQNSDGYQMPSSYAEDTFRIIGPDLVITDLYFSNENPIMGEEITIYAVVMNLGEYDADGFSLTFYRGSVPAAGNEIETVDYTSTFAVLESQLVEVNWTVSDSAVSALVSATECNPLNNQKSKDINATISCGDGYCNGGETCSSCPTDCGTCPPAPPWSPTFGAGPGSGIPPCTVDWICTEWGDCSPEGIQTRVCQNAGTCAEAGLDDRPIESQSCEYTVPTIPTGNATEPGEEPEVPEDTETPPGILDGITGFFIANGSLVGGIIMVIVLAGIGAYYWRKNREQK